MTITTTSNLFVYLLVILSFILTTILCSISASSLPLMWLNQSVIFGQNDFLFSDNGRVKLEGDQNGNVQSYTLTLTDLGLMDEGVYECQVPGRFPLRQRHNLYVNSKYSMLLYAVRLVILFVKGYLCGITR